MVFIKTTLRPSNFRSIMGLIFEQFFDLTSSTYTYLIGDLDKREAVFIDTVKDCVARELEFIKKFNFTKIYLLSTHIHADHVTGNALMKEALGKKAVSVISTYYENAKADIKVREGEAIESGAIKLNFIHTPGHTSGCMCIVDHTNKRVFTGDTLLIRGCGRTDFQGGSSEKLYDSVHQKLFKLPKDYLVYPAHDYKGQKVSSIRDEIEQNPRLTKSKEEFMTIMANLNLAYPKLIDIAVPANLNCGYAEPKIV